MPDGEVPRRSAGSLLPGSLYKDLGLKSSAVETADALTAVALEEHFVWAGIRLRRERAAQGVRFVRNDTERTFITNDRLDADLAPRNELVTRIGSVLGVSNQMAELATTMLELHIDTRLVSGEPFTIPGLLITGDPQAERAEWMYRKWVSDTERPRFERRAGFRRVRRPLWERLDWILAITTRPAAPYRIQLLVASDVPSREPESVPWTDVTLGSPPSAGPATLTTE